MSEYHPGIGDVMFIAFKPIAKMAAITLGGALLCRKGMMSPEATKANAGIIVNLLLPMLVFSTVATSFDSDNVKAIAGLLITGAMYQLMGLGFGFVVRWLMPVPKTWRGGVLVSGSFYNWGDLLIALVLSIAKNAPFNGEKDGNRGVAFASVFIITQTLSMFSLGGTQIIERDFRTKEESPDPEKAPFGLKPTVTAITQRAAELVSRGSSSVRRRPSGAPRAPAVRLTCEGETSNTAKKNVKPSSNLMIEPRNTVSAGDNDESMIEEQRPSQPQTTVNSLISRIPPMKGAPASIQPEKPGLAMRLWARMAPFFAPPAIAMIMALIVANAPPLKALFVHTQQFDMPDAPDNKPPLDFILEICSFGGSAVPVIGMILLGATLARMSIQGLPKGFWKSAVSMAILKLIVGPIIGLIWTKFVMNRTGLIDPDDSMLQFVMIICAGVPTATLQVYITNIHASEKSVEMSALSAMLLAQYAVMLPSLTVLVTYTLMKAL